MVSPDFGPAVAQMRVSEGDPPPVDVTDFEGAGPEHLEVIHRMAEVSTRNGDSWHQPLPDFSSLDNISSFRQILDERVSRLEEKFRETR